MKGVDCGKPAHTWIEGMIELMGKEVKVKIPICKAHLDEELGNYSASV